MQRSLAAATLALAGLAASAAAHTVQGRDVSDVCNQLSAAMSNTSSVNFPGLFATSYKNDVGHWMTSSSQDAACSVEPATAEDVAAILTLLGETKTPFAVKGGGHASNPGFSSTTGVQISMSKLSGVVYDAAANTATVGAGLIWDDVYAALEPYGVMVVGGRVTGVGVAGFTLGGGFSWKTNQLGLTIDNLAGYELVMPNGTIAQVSAESYPDLFWGLKGGFNNFGIVTNFVLKTHAQGQVWGGLMTILGTHLHDVSNATVKFQQTVTDPKAAILPTYNFLLGSPGISLLMFYDGPTPPSGIFDDFLAIPHFTKDVKTRSFIDLVQVAPANMTGGQRGIFHTVSLLEYTPTIMDAVVNETKFWGERLSLQSGTFVSYDVEPFLSSIFSHSPDNSSAYPPSRAQGLLPLNIYYAYLLEAEDETMYAAARASAAHLAAVVEAEGQDVGDAALYNNYAMFDTPLERLYGANVDALKALHAKYDPEGVMDLAGGWKFS